MDQEQIDAFNSIRGAIGSEANTTRGEINRVHKRIDDEKDTRQKEAAAHDKESAVRANQMANDIAKANGTAARAVGKVDRHTEWHDKQEKILQGEEKIQKGEKRQSKAIWVAIAIAIVGWLVTVLKDCGSSF